MAVVNAIYCDLEKIFHAIFRGSAAHFAHLSLVSYKTVGIL
jgi:hypothetical protein